MKVDAQMLSLMAGVAFLTHFALVHRLKLSITHMEGGARLFRDVGFGPLELGFLGSVHMFWDLGCGI